MSKQKKSPSKNGVSSTSMKGDAGPGNTGSEKGRHGNNEQYTKKNM